MVKDKIKFLLGTTGKKQTEFAEYLGQSKQQVSNRFSGKQNGIGIKDLLKLADFTGTKLAFVDENNNVIIDFSLNDLAPEKEKNA